MDCPRCKIALGPTHIRSAGRKAATQECANCGGHWFEVGELRKIDEVVDVVLLEWRRLPEKSDQYAELPCPQCGGGIAMEKVQSHRDKNVIMDVCRSCRGTWLDGGELEAIQVEGLFPALVSLLRSPPES